METKKETITRIFNQARMRGLCKTQRDFAELLCLNQTTVSKALQGDERYLTKSLLKRIETWAQQVMGEDAAAPVQAQPAQPQRPDIVIPAATADLYNNMSETIRIQAEIIARLQAGAGSAIATGAPKNFYLDPK